jgi:hypothetical protein
MPFNSNDELDMRVTVAEWNVILTHLQEGVYRIVHPLINKINLQGAQHNAAKEAQEAREFEQQAAATNAGYTNGEISQPDIALAGDSTGTVTLVPDK